MITNILNQSFADFATKVGTVEEKGQRTNLDTLASYYTNRVSTNETELVTKYAANLITNKDYNHEPDPRLYMRRDLLSLVQDSYALGIADAITDLEDVQFSDAFTSATFALSSDDKLQRDISKLQRDIQASQNIVRQTKTLDGYTKTLRALQKQAQALQNTQAVETLTKLGQELQGLKTANTVRGTTKLINQQLQKGESQRQSVISDINQKEREAATDAKTESYIYSGEKEYYDKTPDTGDYLVKRAIEEKLKYLQNRKDSLAQTPPVVLDEDSDFFKWYAQKRLVPIANRYQQGLTNKNAEAKKIATEYTEKLNNGTITQAAKGDYTDRIVRKILNIEEKAIAKGRPIKRVQRVVATELAIAYNVGRLKAYMKAGIQYVTISTSEYSSTPCDYCLDTEVKSRNNPISIASLLKNAYKNRGFDKSLSRPIESRYLVHHPYCYCVYLPHPKQDPEDKQESAGIYEDPNSWKFILGAGLGVSLVFLAFALTTGRKIDIPVPTTIPQIIPTKPVQQIVGTNIAAPIVKKQTGNIIPRTIPEPYIKSIRTDTREALLLRSVIQDLRDNVQTIPISAIQKKELADTIDNIARTSSLNVVDILDEAELALAQSQSPAYAKLIVDNIAKKRGLIKELYFRRFDKVADKFATIKPSNNIQKLETRIQSYLSQTQADIVIRTANNIEKTSIDAQLQPISLLRSDLSTSLERVSRKANKKEADLSYINDLKYRIADLDNFINILQQQKQQLQNIKTSIRVVNIPLIKQQIANTQALVDRLIIDTTVLEEAQDAYQNLLEMLIALPEKEAIKYRKVQTDLNRRIKNAQGVSLKRFTGNIISFT